MALQWSIASFWNTVEGSRQIAGYRQLHGFVARMEERTARYPWTPSWEFQLVHPPSLLQDLQEMPPALFGRGVRGLRGWKQHPPAGLHKLRDPQFDCFSFRFFLGSPGGDSMDALIIPSGSL